SDWAGLFGSGAKIPTIIAHVSADVRTGVEATLRATTVIVKPPSGRAALAVHVLGRFQYVLRREPARIQSRSFVTGTSRQYELANAAAIQTVALRCFLFE